jgi:hypothetical protein
MMVAENAIVSLPRGQCWQYTYLREAHEHARIIGGTGAAVGVVLAEFIFEATTGIVMVKCVEKLVRAERSRKKETGACRERVNE